MSIAALAALVGNASTVGDPDPPPPAPAGDPTDYYVSLAGTNTNTGLSWGQAKGTLAGVASAAINGSRIWVAPGTYSLSSPVSYSGKSLLWIAPPRIAGQQTGLTGNVYVTGNVARYFDVGTSAGGGILNFAFDVDGNTSCAVRITDVTHFRMEGCYQKSSNNVLNHTNPMLRVEGTSNVSGLQYLFNDSHAAPHIYSHPTANKAYNWRILHNHVQKSNSGVNPFFLQPSIDLATADYDGLIIAGSYTETNTSPAISVNMTGVSGRRRIWFHGIGMERCSVPAVKMWNSRPIINMGGGTNNTNGSYWGSGTTSGYVMSVAGVLSGDLVPGAN